MKTVFQAIMAVTVTLALVLGIPLASAQVPPSPPDAPSGLTATAVSLSQIDLSWTDNSATEIGFSIERSSDGVAFAPVGTAAANATAFSDATAPGAGSFSYRVIATSAAGHSAPSNVASVSFVLPNAPSGLAAILAGGPTGPQMNVTWTDNSDNETGFRVERSQDSFATAPDATFAANANATTFSDTTAERPHTYYYRVVAVNAAGDSAASNSASAGWVGPIDPAFIFQGNVNSSFPGYYADSHGTRVALLPTDGPPAPQQIFEDVDPLNPYSVFLGMGGEAFYYIAEASFNTTAGIAKTRFAVEANTAAPGDEVVFTRTRIFAKVPAAGTYRFVHPYGEETIEVTQDDVDANRGIRFTNDVGLATRSFHLAAAATGPIDGFLLQAAPPAGWIGDGVTAGPVTGSPTGFNKVRLVAPNGVNLNGSGGNVVETDLFTVAARLQTTAAPSPSFTKALQPASCVAPCAVSLTDTSAGATARSWDFGDGTKSTLQNPSKTYNAPGAYTITLTATNAGGTGSASQTVNVYSRPAASFTRTLPNGLPPAAITFTDTSSGHPTSWLWSFGDGTGSTLRNPTKVYALAGTYNVTLTVENAAGPASTAQTLNISNALVPGFTASALSGVAPLTVDFADASTGTITSRSWNFGDGSAASTELNPSHVFASAGNYTVTLTVTDASGSAAALQVISVYVAPVAGFTKSAASGTPPLVVNFTDTSTGNPSSRLWVFGDGTTSSLANPRKVYAAAGVYPVTLTVSNAAGSSFATQTVSVSGAFASSTPPSLQVGPIDPAFIYQGNPNTSFPGYYEDDQGTRVALLPITGNGLTAPTQIYEPVDPEDPYSVFLGSGEEAFYWIAAADFTTMGGAGRGHARFAVEANFAGPGGEVVFTRTRFVLNVPVPGDYTIEYPYGTQTFTITQEDIDARGGLFFTEDIGLAERDFLLAGTGPIARFLHQSNPPPPAGWIGDGATAGTVTGSPTGFNMIRVTGPVGANLSGSGSNIVETDQFSVAARLQTAVAPEASFTKTLDPLDCTAPCTVTLTDTSTGAPTGWSWDFGDGATSTVQNPAHVYNAGGVYAITLTAANAAGTSSASQAVTVYAAPVASFTKSASAGIAPLLVKFNDTSTGNITSWSWDLGDGTTSSLQDPTRVYAKSGVYTVTLAVTNPLGTASTSQTVTVESVPAPPSGLSATLIGDTQIDLAWTDNALDELGHFVQRSTNGAAFTTLATLAANAAAYSDPTVAVGSTYAYRTVAFNVVGDSLPSNVAGVGLTPPSAPSDLGLANPPVTQVDLTWTDNSDSETSFRIERSTDGVIFVLAGNVGADVTAFSDTAVVQGVTYTFRVLAVNAFGDSAPSNPLQVTVGFPAAPSGLTATAISATQVDLTWVDNASNETGFRVERSPDGITFTTLATLDPNVTSYSNTPVAKKTTYHYRVFAFNAMGDSFASNVATVTTPNTAPLAPTGLAVTNAAPNGIELAWTDASDNEDTFLLERSTDGTTFSQVTRLNSATMQATGGPVTYTDASVVVGATYQYRVRAGNELGDSSASNTVTITAPNVGLTGLRSATGLTVNNAGVVQGNASLRSTDGTITLNIAAGTRTRQRNGQPITALTLGPLAGTPPKAPPNNALVLALDFGPDGVDFNPSAQMIVAYQPGTLPAGVRQDRLDIAIWDGNGWLKLKGQVNTAARTVTAQIPHFTPVAILGDQDKPLDVKAVVAGPRRVDLDWTDNMDNESGFRIQRSVSGGPFNEIGTRQQNETHFSDNDAPAGVPLSYRVVATNSNGDSPESDEGRTLVAPPAPPADPTVTDARFGQITLEWVDNSNNETGFHIQRFESNPPFATIATTAMNKTKFVDLNVAAGARYSYRVVAFNALGETASEATSVVVAPGVEPPPTAPQPTPTPVPPAVATPTPAPAPQTTPTPVPPSAPAPSSPGSQPAPAATATPTPQPEATPVATSPQVSEKEIEVELHADDKVDRAAAEARDDNGNDVRLTGDDVKIRTEAEGKIVVTLPLAASAGSTLKSFEDRKSGMKLSDDTLIKPIKDNSGKAVMDIVAKVEKIETEGPTTRITIKSMALRTAEQQQDMSAADPKVGKVSANVQVELKQLFEGASLKVTMDKKADDRTEAAIEQAVSSSGRKLADVAFVMNVQKRLLENVRDLGAAVITMKVSSDWVNAHGGPNSVKIIRVSEDGDKEVLDTRMASSEAGQVTFEGVSPKGLSAFALAAVAASPAQQPAPTPTPVPAPTATPSPTPVVPAPTPTPRSLPPSATPTAAPAPAVPAPTPTPAPAAIVPPPAVVGAVSQVIDPDRAMVVELPDMTRIEVPAGALPALQMQARAIRAEDLPSAPDGQVVKALDITLFNLQGKPLGPTDMATPIILRIPLKDEDVKLMNNNPLNARVEYLDPADGQWETVSATVDVANKMVNAQVTHMSLFAVVVLQPTAAGGGMGWLVPVIIAILAVAAAAILLYLRRRQTVDEPPLSPPS